MDAYQNLISGDKRYNERKVIVAGGCCPNTSTLYHKFFNFSTEF